MWIEFKTDSKLKEIQQIKLRQWAKAGAMCFVLRKKGENLIAICYSSQGMKMEESIRVPVLTPSATLGRSITDFLFSLYYRTIQLEASQRMKKQPSDV